MRPQPLGCRKLCTSTVAFGRGMGRGRREFKMQSPSNLNPEAVSACALSGPLWMIEFLKVPCAI